MGRTSPPGYWRAPEATQDTMIGEWLRTGDLGRIDAAGNIWITGRSKYVIVLDSGEKVHPEEVEEQLARSQLIDQVCLYPRQTNGATELWATVYPNVRFVSELNRRNVLAWNAAGIESAVRSEVERA